MLLDFDAHALLRLRRRQIPEVAAYALIGDHDLRIDRDDGRTEYYGLWEGRSLLIIVEWQDDEETDGYVVTVIDANTRERRRREP